MTSELRRKEVASFLALGAGAPPSPDSVESECGLFADDVDVFASLGRRTGAIRPVTSTHQCAAPEPHLSRGAPPAECPPGPHVGLAANITARHGVAPSRLWRMGSNRIRLRMLHMVLSRARRCALSCSMSFRCTLACLPRFAFSRFFNRPWAVTIRCLMLNISLRAFCAMDSVDWSP